MGTKIIVLTMEEMYAAIEQYAERKHGGQSIASYIVHETDEDGTVRSLRSKVVVSQPNTANRP